MEKIEENQDTTSQQLHGYEFYQSIGSPQYVCAPMVDQSELPFRMLTRQYRCQLAYTPMLHSKMMITHPTYKQKNFSTCQEDRPLVAQFCGNQPQVLLKAAQMVQDEVDAVDINFGCPQGIAQKGHYGSFLLSQPDLIVQLVSILHQNLKVPVLCQIRILPNEEKTLDLALRIQEAGCSILTVHGRTKQQNKDRVGSCNWDIIQKIKETLQIPVFANGGIYTFQDIEKCLHHTNVDGIMVNQILQNIDSSLLKQSAESLLENPALFSGKIYDLNEIAIEYLDLCQQYNTQPHAIKAHLFKILHTGLKTHTHLRDQMGSAKSFNQFYDITEELRELQQNVPLEEKFGWYLRYQNKEVQMVTQNGENQPQESQNDEIKKVSSE